MFTTRWWHKAPGARRLVPPLLTVMLFFTLVFTSFSICFNLACECLYHGEIFHVEIEQVENSNITPTLSFNRTKTLDRSTLQYCTSALGSQTHTHRELNIIIKH